MRSNKMDSSLLMLFSVALLSALVSVKASCDGPHGWCVAMLRDPPVHSPGFENLLESQCPPGQNCLPHITVMPTDRRSGTDRGPENVVACKVCVCFDVCNDPKGVELTKQNFHTDRVRALVKESAKLGGTCSDKCNDPNQMVLAELAFRVPKKSDNLRSSHVTN